MDSGGPWRALIATSPRHDSGISIRRISDWEERGRLRGAKGPREGARESAGWAGLRQAESFGQEKKRGEERVSARKEESKESKQSTLNPRLDFCVRKVESAEKKR